MPLWIPVIMSFAALASALAWLAILFLPGRFWALLPRDDEEKEPVGQAPKRWPEVAILVPARNEAETLPQILPALLSQDYPGSFGVYLTDDRSADGTGETARKIAAAAGQSERLTVVTGTDFPPGETWVGKMWALAQAARAAGFSVAGGGEKKRRFFLLTDADILHQPDSLRKLVRESLAEKLGLNSRMARLHCQSPAERLLMPAFLFFFNLLYPMRRVNSPLDDCAAAAGGCILISEEALATIGGFEALRDELIDDVAAARLVKKAKFPIRLSLSVNQVVSLRVYATLNSIWAMVRRTAFTELKYSWLRLFGAVAGLKLLFVFPSVSLLLGLWTLAEIRAGEPLETSRMIGLWIGCKGAIALFLSCASYLPTVRYFRLARWWSLTLPVAGILYLLMTLDSALRYATGTRSAWKGRTYSARK